jgi:hypothetical protein
MEYVPLPFSAAIHAAFLASASAAPNADALLARLSTHAAAHNGEAAEWLQRDGPALKDALRQHPTFFDPTTGLLRAIAALAAPLHAHFPRGLPLLRAAPARVALPRAAAACLLANMFLCALPRPHPACPEAHLAMLFSFPWDSSAPQKLLCVLHYFERVAAAPPTGVVALERVSAPPQLLRAAAGGGGGGGDDGAGGTTEAAPEAVHAFFSACAAPLLPLQVLPGRDSIHDARGHLLADFANKFIGGGVLGGGCVQEEIMFLVAPESLVSLLLAPVMQGHEAIVIAGAERYSAHTGYAATFAYAGDLVDACGVVGEGEACGALTPGSARTALVAFDALPFSWRLPQAAQLAPEAVLRELLKASAAFGLGQAREWPEEVGCGAGVAPPVATGHWGCGAFNGAWCAARVCCACVCVPVCSGGGQGCTGSVAAAITLSSCSDALTLTLALTVHLQGTSRSRPWCSGWQPLPRGAR